jgi:hypothetical protein
MGFSSVLLGIELTGLSTPINFHNSSRTQILLLLLN